jgi:hypothetical protein
MVCANGYSGILLIIFMGSIATYNGYVIGQYSRAHPSVHSFAGAGATLFKRCPKFGAGLFATIMICVLIFIMAAHVVGFQVMMIVSSPIDAHIYGPLILPDSCSNPSMQSDLGCVRNRCAVLVHDAPNYETRFSYVVAL